MWPALIILRLHGRRVERLPTKDDLVKCVLHYQSPRKPLLGGNREIRLKVAMQYCRSNRVVGCPMMEVNMYTTIVIGNWVLSPIQKAAFLLVWSRVEMTQPVDTCNDFPLSDTGKVSSSSAFYFTCLPDKRSSRKGQNRWQWLDFLIHDRWNSLQRFSRCSKVVSSAMCFGTRSTACPGYTLIVIHLNSESWNFEVFFAGYEFVVALQGLKHCLFYAFFY